jgi:hypothetical protein
LSYAQAQNQTYLALCPIFIQLNIFAMDTQKGCPLKNVFNGKTIEEDTFCFDFPNSQNK